MWKVIMCDHTNLYWNLCSKYNNCKKCVKWNKEKQYFYTKKDLGHDSEMA